MTARECVCKSERTTHKKAFIHPDLLSFFSCKFSVHLFQTSPGINWLQEFYPVYFFYNPYPNLPQL